MESSIKSSFESSKSFNQQRITSVSHSIDRFQNNANYRTQKVFVFCFRLTIINPQQIFGRAAINYNNLAGALFIMALSVGKLDFKLLEKFLSKYCLADSSVLIGPKLGLDSAVLRLDNNLLVAKTDPITFASDLIGWYAVNVNANDIAVCGAKPKWFLATILLPEYKATKALAEKIFSQISQACKKLGVSFVGGHTEITVNLDRPIVVGCMLGTTTKKKLITSAGAKQNDVLIITKGVVIEGTSIIAREKEKVLGKKFSRPFIEKAKRYLFTPGISVVKDALLASKYANAMHDALLASKYANAMHDPTEGGLLTGIYEMMLASGKGCLIYADRIPVLKEAKILCEEFNLNPLATISSGTLLISARKENAEKLLRIYRRNRIKAAIIGEVKDKRFGMKLMQNGKIKPLKCSARDDIAKIF